eukprot:TRINITY_DN3237_c0_g1_i1.p1 TRINITY_DN3237_c0_g1~~TRINITY_DN3237_c0_g1_i1.p1  ORF type:complete len:275 (+),score=46.99 TRINITY_DN3237_c0_g1_i1:235-1059(+)
MEKTDTETAAPSPAPKSVRTTIKYVREWSKDMDKNVIFSDVMDIRQLEEPPLMDINGFQVVSIPQLNNYEDKEELKAKLYPVVEEAVKKSMGASRVEFNFSPVIRRRRDLPNKELREHTGQGTDQQPVPVPHADYSFKSGPLFLEICKGKNAAKSLLGHRFALLQFWLPMKGPVMDAPLAVMDPSSLQPDDVRPVETKWPEWVQETYHFAHNASHKWYYLSNMMPTEGYLFKGYDSLETVPRYTPHCAFILPDAPPDAPRRESLELRFFAFWDN